jgi:hypothetical protein
MIRKKDILIMIIRRKIIVEKWREYIWY